MQHWRVFFFLVFEILPEQMFGLPREGNLIPLSFEREDDDYAPYDIEGKRC